MFDLIDREALKKKYCDCCAVSPDCIGGSCKIYDARCLIAELPTVEAAPVRRGRWNDDCTEVVCSNCKSEFSYEMLIYIARGIKSEHVDGMTCRCPKCGSYNIYGGEQDADD